MGNETRIDGSHGLHVGVVKVAGEDGTDVLPDSRELGPIRWDGGARGDKWRHRPRLNYGKVMTTDARH
jgi:hypothetical protein